MGALARQEKITDIIKGCKRGKRKSQEALFRLFADKMFGVCRYYTKDYTEAEDILHDGFLKVFDKISKFREEGSLEGWIRRIMINTALERIRRNHHMYSLAEEQADNIPEETVPVESQITENELMEMIQELTPQYRLVFNLYAIEGYSHKEISTMAGISEGTSKSNLARARVILQKKIMQRTENEVSRKLSS
jgi:RNA polymerase sigma-70 factor (ECF subfamily)